MSVCVFLVKEGYHPLKVETVGLIIATQDQSLATRLYNSNVIKDVISAICRMCGCPELAKTEYIQLGLSDVTGVSRRFYC